MTPAGSSSSIVRYVGAVGLVAVVYILSSGPVLSVAFWLRERTGRDEFYWTMWLYLPLLLMGPESVFHRYVEFWVGIVGAPGPG